MNQLTGVCIMIMNARDRVFAAAHGKKTDCCPVTPYHGNCCIHLAGQEISNCYTNGKNLADAQIITQELIGQDVVNAQSDQYYIVEAMGVKTHYEKGRLPIVDDIPVKTLEDIRKLRVPNPYTEGRMHVYIEAVENLTQHYKKQVAVRAPGSGPFSMAGHLMGISEFITQIAVAEALDDQEEQKRILDMLEICTNALLEFSKACVKAGADIVQCADSLASLNMISPSIYEKYAFPFEKKYFSEMANYKKDHSFLTLLHICGNNTLIADKLANTGCDILEVDSAVDLADYKQRIGDRVCLMGNINPFGALYQGSIAEVEQECKTAIAKAHAGGRFCLGSGCEVAIGTPLENLVEMVRVGHSAASSIV